MRACARPSLFVLICPGPALVTFPPAPPKATYIFFTDKARPRSPLAALASAPSGAHVLQAAASKGLWVRGLSWAHAGPPTPFASQYEATFPLFNAHFPHDMRISMTLPNLVLCLLLPPFTRFLTLRVGLHYKMSVWCQR